MAITNVPHQAGVSVSVRRLVRRLAVIASSWQCCQCGAWFESETPSQTCGSCG